MSALKVYVAGEHGGPLDLRDDLRQQEGVELVWDGSAAEVVLYAFDGPLRRDRVRGLAGASAAPVVLAARRADADLLDQALEADVADIVLLPESPDRIVFSLLKAARKEERRATAPAVPDDSAKMITVFAPKGGTGKTVVSTNVAAYLARRGLRTLLVDLDLQFGDAAIMLGLEPQRTLYDLASAPGGLDADKLHGYVTTHGHTGLEVLAAPLRPEEGELVGEQKIEEILQLAAPSYDVILVDTWPSFHGPTLSALDRADTVLLVCNPEVPTLKDVRMAIETLRRLSFPEERLNVVLNRADDREIVRKREVEEALGLRVAYELPRAYEVTMAVNRGEPLVLMSKAHPFSAAVNVLGDSLVGAAEVVPVPQPQRQAKPAWSIRGLPSGPLSAAGSGA